MRFYELFSESKGFFGRKPGDPYVNANGVTADFVQVMPYPDPKQGMFPDAENMESTISQIESQTKTKITWVNQPRNNLAFAVAQLQTSDGDTILWGRYLNTTQGVLAGKWRNSEIPPGWKLNTATAQKIAVGYDPQTLVGVGTAFANIDLALKAIETKTKNVQNGDILFEALTALRNGQLPVFPGMAKQMTALRDYFGEIMTPVALASGIVGGDAETAREELLGEPWANAKVKWPQSKTHNLVDSVFVNSKGFELNISSKGGQGAKASAKNIYDAILRAKANSPELIKSYKKVVDIITLIHEQSAIQAPLSLAVNMGMINAKTVTECINMINKGERELPRRFEKLCSNYSADRTHQNYNAGLHLLSSIAKHVALQLNSMPQMSKGIQAFMNQSSMVQIYLDMKVKGEDAVVTGFRSIYPPRFEGQMMIDAGKNYFATAKPNKMAFGFK